jgi:endonuclease III
MRSCKRISPHELVESLQNAYSLHKTALKYQSPWQLLVSIILSAQCTDARVNQVTPRLFKKLPTIQRMAFATLPTIERLIYSTGFYKNKAKNIKSAAQTILQSFQGTIPDSMEQLIMIPGVGRKTANVYLQVVHRKAEGVVVDTHIFRVSRRTGASRGKTPEQVERELMRKLPKQDWMRYGDLAIQHGRRVCRARRPLCRQCILKEECPRIGCV